MTGIEIAMLVSSLASLYGGGGGGGQDLNTFEGETVGDLMLDPRQMLGYGITGNARLGEDLYERLMEGISLPGAYAQQPPGFTGGGLPMPIGVTGVDPAIADPGAHLRIPGFGGRDVWQGLGNLMSGDPNAPDPNAPEPPGPEIPPRDPNDPRGEDWPEIQLPPDTEWPWPPPDSPMPLPSPPVPPQPEPPEPGGPDTDSPFPSEGLSMDGDLGEAMAALQLMLQGGGH